MTLRDRYKLLTITTLIFLYSVTPCSSETITGKVVRVTDGDTITVLQDRQQYKIRLYGIDAPEKRQNFGNKAKQFLSDKIAGKVVTVVVVDKDRYGRSVGRQLKCAAVSPVSARVVDQAVGVHRRYRVDITERGMGVGPQDRPRRGVDAYYGMPGPCNDNAPAVVIDNVGGAVT